MTEKKDAETRKPRTQVKDLPKQKKELSKDEQKKIKGGPIQATWLPFTRNGGTGGNNT